jgi:hypothetical protein
LGSADHIVAVIKKTAWKELAKSVKDSKLPDEHKVLVTKLEKLKSG